MPTRAMDWDSVQADVEQKLKVKPADDVKKKITIPNPVPAGNHLAHFIRSIHWNSKGMLPSTAGSQRTYDKYGTVTSLSFQGPDGFEIKPGEAAGGFSRKKETIEDIMLNPRKNQMFNRWKVPDRLMESAPPGRLEEIPDIEPAVPRTPSAKSSSSQKAPGTPRGPATPRAPSVRPLGVSREMSREYNEEVPNIRLKSTSDRAESRNGLQKSGTLLPKSAEMIPKRGTSPLYRSKTMVLPPRISDTKAEVASFESALRPEAVPQAEAWMKNADKADRKVIERILKMASSKHKLENSLRNTLLPDAKDSVEKWMKGANENERQVALDFFNSLAGGQLMGMTVESKRKRLKEVINTLENAQAGPAGNRYKLNAGRRRKEILSDGNLKYIRLLTPDTRENRWMFSTWHHLPEYRNENVENWSSHYIRPHAGIPRHFTIHPDWGP